MNAINIEANGHKIEARKGETVLSALRRAGIHVPTLCHVEGLTPTGACRLCVVEVDGARNLVPSCSFPVAEGMRIKSDSPRVIQARRTLIELLLANHPDDCLFCGRSGACELQTLSQTLGVRQRRYRGVKNRQDLDVSSPSIVRDPDKCVLCGKCVRVCEEVQGVAAIDFIGRGSRPSSAPPSTRASTCRAASTAASASSPARPARCRSAPTSTTCCAPSPTPP